MDAGGVEADQSPQAAQVVHFLEKESVAESARKCKLFEKYFLHKDAQCKSEPLYECDFMEALCIRKPDRSA